MAEIFLGQIHICPYVRTHWRNWALCDGQEMAISANSALFSLLGTNFGGDGRATFGLPDLRGRTAIGATNIMGKGETPSSYRLGELYGAEDVMLDHDQLPTHSHETEKGPGSDKMQVTVPATTGTVAGSDGVLTPTSSSFTQTGYTQGTSSVFQVSKTSGSSASGRVNPTVNSHMGIPHSTTSNLDIPMYLNNPPAGSVVLIQGMERQAGTDPTVAGTANVTGSASFKSLQTPQTDVPGSFVVGEASGSITVSSTGGNKAVSKRAPYQAMTYYILLEGPYPPRS